MSQPTFPTGFDLTREDAINQILSSIAMEELGLSHIINAEGEKLQYFLGTLTGISGPDASPEQIIEVNKNIESLLRTASINQMFLSHKMSDALGAAILQGPTGPQGPTGSVSDGALFNIVDPQGNIIPLDYQNNLVFQSDTLDVNVTTGSAIVSIDIPAGSTGVTGATGPTGADGITGPAGAIGTPGAIGPTGADGTTGPAGTIGTPGTTGPTGADGATGPAGATGEPGTTGAAGPQGASGIQGIQGIPGTVGTILGSLNSTGDLPVSGALGDMYYISPNIYVWNEDTSSWDDLGEIAGPQGIDGPQGAQGPIGNTGPAGNDGAPGATGPQGDTGAAGVPGAPGSAGDTGAAGATGPAGVTGPAGSTGPAGVTGPAGSSAGGSIVPFATGEDTNLLATDASGNPTNVELAAFGSHSDLYALSSNQFTVDPSSGIYTFTAPYDGVINSIYLNVANYASFTPSGSAVIPYVVLASAPSGTQTFTIISASEADVSTPFVGGTSYPANTCLSGNVTNLGIPITAGTRLAICCAFRVTGASSSSSYYFYYSGSVYLAP